MKQTIREIWFPNTVKDEDKCFYSTKLWYEFKFIFKNWEMAQIKWIEVLKDWKLVAEIKESVCDIFY